MQSVSIITNIVSSNPTQAWLATGWWLSPGTPVSSTNKTGQIWPRRSIIVHVTQINNEYLLYTVHSTNYIIY
jgi:hypothetical protein